MIPAITAAGFTGTPRTKLTRTPFAAINLEIDTRGPKAIVIYAEGHPDYPVANGIYEGTDKKPVKQHDLVAALSTRLKQMVEHDCMTFPSGSSEGTLREELLQLLNARSLNTYKDIAKSGAFTRGYDASSPQNSFLRLELPATRPTDIREGARRPAEQNPPPWQDTNRGGDHGDLVEV